jgi:hypothetical protein
MEREPAAPSSDETVEVDPDETTRADTEWPVAEQFRVTPEPVLVQREHDGTPPAAVAGPGRRRLTSAPTLAVILAILALLVLLAAGTAWLVTGDDPTQASTRPPTGQKSAVKQSSPKKITETPAPSKPESPPGTTSADPTPAPAPEVAVPSVVGLPASDAARKIRAAGLRSQVRLITSSRTAGTVIAQSPAAGEASEREGVV